MSDAQITLIAAIASGIGALAAAVATVVLAWLTSKYVRLTNRLVEETRAARAPEVVVDLQFENIVPRLVIANRGPTAAYNVQVKVSERNITWRDSNPKLSDLAPIKKGISFLPPGRTMRYMVGMLDIEKTLAADAALEFEVSYQDDGGATFERQFSLEFAAFNAMLLEGRKPHEVIAEAIRNAAEHLKPRTFFMKRTRACPVCYEQIRAEARKCPHCLEAVEPLPPEKAQEKVAGSAT